jgi:prepilin-type N-terminal cleavage/methylation domain-containing protein
MFPRLWALNKRHKQGFTLTEIAIVLGVIGVILGAIWVAASTVNNNQRVTKATQQIITIVNNIRALESSRSTFSSSLGPMTDITAMMVNAGVFPADMINNNGTSFNPWGGSVIINVIPNSPGANLSQFEVLYYPPAGGNIPCANLLTKTTGPGQDSGLQYVYDSFDGWQSAAGGTLGLTNFTKCSGAVAWTFNLKG